MTNRPALLLAMLLLLVQPAAASAQTIYRGECRGSFQGVDYRGILAIERWDHHDTHLIFGEFRDGAGNLVNFEVHTNQPGGWGEVWVNHARHRGERILIELRQGGFVAQLESGGAARFVCS